MACEDIMSNRTKAVLTVIALCVLALPVKAEKKVYYCVDDASAGIVALDVAIGVAE